MLSSTMCSLPEGNPRPPQTSLGQGNDATASHQHTGTVRRMQGRGHTAQTPATGTAGATRVTGEYAHRVSAAAPGEPGQAGGWQARGVRARGGEWLRGR